MILGTIKERSDARRRLDPFQSNVALGTMASQILRKDTPNPRKGVTSAGIENKWMILGKDRAPEPALMNGSDVTQTIKPFKDESFTAPVQEQLQEQRLERLKALTRPVEFRSGQLNDLRFKILQKWEGVVTEVKDGFLFARLRDLTNQNPDEEAEIALEEISPDDKHLVQLGASFYWSIGYLHQSHGTRTRASEIRFRRVPAWTSEDIASAKMQAQSDALYLNLNCGNTPT